MTTTHTAELPAHPLVEPVPVSRSSWRRSVPWILAFGPFALLAGAGVGYGADVSLRAAAPPILAAAVPVSTFAPPAAPLAVAPAFVAPRPTVSARVAPLVRTHAAATVTIAPSAAPLRLALSVTPHPTATPAASSEPTSTPTGAPGNDHGPDESQHPQVTATPGP